MKTKNLADNVAEMKGMAEYVKANPRPGRSQAETDSWAAEYEKQAALLADGYSIVVALRRGMSTVYGPKVDAVGVHGFVAAELFVFGVECLLPDLDDLLVRQSDRGVLLGADHGLGGSDFAPLLERHVGRRRRTLLIVVMVCECLRIQHRPHRVRVPAWFDSRPASGRSSQPAPKPARGTVEAHP